MNEKEKFKEVFGFKDVPTEGRKFDSDKLRWDLLDIEFPESVVEVLTFGAKKYEPDNWRKVDNGINRYYAAALRHLSEWRKGNKIDTDSGLPHLAHVATNLYFLSWFDKKDK